MKNIFTVFAALFLGACLADSAVQAHSVRYVRPGYSRYYEPVVYETVRTYRKVLEEVPVYEYEPVVVRRACPVRSYRYYGRPYYRPCRRYAPAFYGGFNFSFGF